MASTDRREPDPGATQPISTHAAAPQSRTKGLAIAALVAALGAGVYWRQVGAARPQPVVESAGQSAAEIAAARPKRPGYVGMQACAACHAKRVAEFQATRHCLACLPTDPATMPAAFSAPNAVFAGRDENLHFEMTRKGDEFFVTAVQKTPQGEQRTASRIDLIYGSGAGTDEVYLSWRGDLLYELPISWLHPEQAWGASAFTLAGPESIPRELTPKCLDCHNTWFEHQPGTLNQYRREGAILGVTCEKCHGPGADHVAFHEAHPGVKSAEAIVRPARLSRERQIDLCAQCHSNAIVYRGPAFSYAPGEPLDDHFRTVDVKSPEEDHVANQVTYMRESKCFRNSETLSCTTCHNPHQPRKTGPAAAQSACLSCHQPVDCGERAKLPAAVQDNCVGCHMPVSKKVQVFFRTEAQEFEPPVNRWEHRIGIYPAAEQEVLLAWRQTQDDADSRAEVERLTASLNEHWLAEAERCRQSHQLLSAIYAYRRALELRPAAETRAKLDEAVASRKEFSHEMSEAGRLMAEQKMADAIVHFQNALKIVPDFGKAHGRLGAAYAATGQNELAVEHLQASEKYDPDDPYAPGMLGWLAYLEGRMEDALQHYHRTEAIDPYNAQLNFQLGLALASLGRWSEAEKRFRKALEIDPNHAGACQGLSHALRQQGQTEEALRYALRAARLTQFQHFDILVTLADSYADANRPLEAGKAASKAIAAAHAAKARLSAENRLRMELLQDRAKRFSKAGS